MRKAGGNKDKYVDAKQKSQHAVYTVKRNAEKEKFASVEGNKENIFRVAKQMRTENQDVIGDPYIDVSKKLAWKQHYKRLLNIEFPWSQSLAHINPITGPAHCITSDDILKSFRHVKNRKATLWCCCRNVESCH